ncbi:hypothetical protein [Streptomyces sp. NPDC021562]|uniref:hypothetical protein n=1 Tax=Streptomyces sp. NPDC021562 TaxID=3155121 RepID=UPI001045531F
MRLPREPGARVRAALAELLRTLEVAVLMVTHDPPYALEPGPRALLPGAGTIAADGPTGELRSGTALLRARRLGLRFHSDPRAASARRQEM